MSKSILIWRSKLNQCWYCGCGLTPNVRSNGVLLPNSKTTDHVTPRSKDGSNRKINKVPACYSCNREKGSMSLEEFRRYKGVRYFWGEEYELLILR